MNSRGFSLIDAMLGSLVLSLGLIIYVKSTSGNVASSVDNAERQMVAILASDINNIFDAYTNNLGPLATQAQVVANYQTISAQMRQELARAAAIRGYRCDNGLPVLTPALSGQVQSNSSLIRSWSAGAYICVDFLMRSDVPTNFNGVWVETKISWVSLKNQQSTPDSITIPILIAPSP